MIGRSVGAIGSLVAALAFLTACPDTHKSEVSGNPGNSNPDPHWVVQQKPRAKLALVYVHGVTSDMVGHLDGLERQDVLRSRQRERRHQREGRRLRVRVPVLYLQSRIRRHREAANRLHLQLKTQGVLDYPAIVFIAHSMGGLVVMRELLTNRDILPKVPVVVFYSTPMEGALIAALGEVLTQLRPGPDDTGGRERAVAVAQRRLAVGSRRRSAARALHLRKDSGGGRATIVPWSSATRFCEGAPPAIEASHVTIVKPDRPGR